MTSMLVPVAAMRVATPRLSSVQHQRRIFTCKPRRSARIGPHTARRTVARSAKDFHVPDRLVTLDEGLARLSSSRDAPAVGAARYHVIFTTGEKMGSGLSAPDAGVQIMLITALFPNAASHYNEDRVMPSQQRVQYVLHRSVDPDTGRER